jgi:hypothetical protein
VSEDFLTQITGTSKAGQLFEMCDSDLNADLVAWSSCVWIRTDYTSHSQTGLESFNFPRVSWRCSKTLNDLHAVSCFEDLNPKLEKVLQATLKL